MAVTKETITVTYVGKFGPRVGEIWYPLSSKSGLKPENFEKGKTYNVLIYTSGTGKKYINQIVGEDVKEEPKVKAGDDKLLEKTKIEKDIAGGTAVNIRNQGRDFDAEARGKVACAAYRAALTSPGLAMYATSKEEYFKLVQEAAEKATDFTWEHQRGREI